MAVIGRGLALICGALLIGVAVPADYEQWSALGAGLFLIAVTFK